MVPSIHNEKELLQRVAGGDTAAFARLYDAYWNKIYSMSMLYMKSPQAAQDIVQDVFMKLWDKRQSLPEVQAFRPFLFVMARNLLISRLRATFFHEDLAAAEGEPMKEKWLLPDRQLSYKESVQLLHQAMDQLAPQQKKAFQLSRTEGLSYREIAEKMQISPLTVRTHISTALASIRLYLNNHALHLMIFLLLSEK